MTDGVGQSLPRDITHTINIWQKTTDYLEVILEYLPTSAKHEGIRYFFGFLYSWYVHSLNINKDLEKNQDLLKRFCVRSESKKLYFLFKNKNLKKYIFARSHRSSNEMCLLFFPTQGILYFMYGLFIKTQLNSWRVEVLWQSNNMDNHIWIISILSYHFKDGVNWLVSTTFCIIDLYKEMFNLCLMLPWACVVKIAWSLVDNNFLQNAYNSTRSCGVISPKLN